MHGSLTRKLAARSLLTIKCVFLLFPQSKLSPEHLQDEEHAKLNKIAELSNSIIELKKKQGYLNEEHSTRMKTKCEVIKKMRIDAYKKKKKELDEKERELCRKTNLLVDELVATCDDTPFHKALIKILRNLKGNF